MKDLKELRTGVTTGLCAAAAAKAAVIMLLSGKPPEQVEVRAKTGAPVIFEVTDAIYEEGGVKCAVQKDAGDDPDITDGVKVFASVSKTDTRDAGGIDIDGGEGIGRVTKPGLKVPVGKAAINPAPRQMIESAIEEARGLFAYTGGVKAVISIPGGAGLAKKTMNERLGVVGGLSVLGTTGVVEPMSGKAVVETIKAEIDVRLASGGRNLVITPGNYGRDFAERELGVDIDEAIKCSNFVGEALDYACLKGVGSILLIGHAGKLVKLAGGVMNTHSGIADCRMEIIAAHAAMTGAGAEVIRRIMECITTQAAIEILVQEGVNDLVWESIGQKIGFHLRERTKGSLALEYVVFTQEHGVLARGEVGRT
ncbi:MAG: cobalt-precorrin-5B (C(1))-methyltransferase CbiD [Syntrophorhabdaceae bacterium]|nr:cobalt-precorrin-5B (C(1))-methyltransferase CbiD [Syntrophorhabdaceae bacterium]